MKNITYQDFLQRKLKTVQEIGFEVQNINPKLFPFQQYAVKLALKKGRFALFEDCGLGKTAQQLVWAHEVTKHTNQPVLILAPLAVTGQTIEEGFKFGIDIYKYDVTAEPCNNEPDIFIANYEQLHNIDTSVFSGVVLDESSILKNFEGKFKQHIIESFANTPYKLACTATPSPNDAMELCNHAEFLNVGKRSEILAQYFVHDGGETSKWRLKGHGVKRFYDYVAQWSLMVSNPADIGFDMVGYNLPKLNIENIYIETEKRDNGQLFNDISVSATDFNKELRITVLDRIEQAAELINNSNEQWIAWVKQNEESKILTDAIDGALEVKGSDSPQLKESRLLGFARNEYKCLVTKAKIAQYGLNFQNCHNQVFVSLDFSFESLYQAIRRSYRFGQSNEVNIYIISTDTMQNVIHTINEKQEQFKQMQKLMNQSYNRIYA